MVKGGCPLLNRCSIGCGMGLDSELKEFLMGTCLVGIRRTYMGSRTSGMLSKSSGQNISLKLFETSRSVIGKDDV